jgi:hypothetical protein
VRNYIAAGVIMLASLSACGGGGGSSPAPISTPTTAPTTAPQGYSVRVKFTGGTSLASPQSLLRQTQGAVTAHPLDSSSASPQLPIAIAVQPPSNSYFSSPLLWQGIATVVVAPQPSTVPTASYAVTGVSATSAPLPLPSGQPTAPPQTVVSATTTSTVGAGSLNVNLTGSVSATTSVPLYVVNRGNIACNDKPVPPQSASQPVPSDQYGGVKFVSGTLQPSATTADADLYIDASWCTGAGFVNSADANTTLYAPHGAAWISSATTPFVGVKASQCGNTFTSMPMASVLQGLQLQTNPNDILLLTTADNHCVKVALNQASAGTPPSGSLNGSPAQVAFSWEEAGFSQDGF